MLPGRRRRRPRAPDSKAVPSTTPRDAHGARSTEEHVEERARGVASSSASTSAASPSPTARRHTRPRPRGVRRRTSERTPAEAVASPARRSAKSTRDERRDERASPTPIAAPSFTRALAMHRCLRRTSGRESRKAGSASSSAGAPSPAVSARSDEPSMGAARSPRASPALRSPGPIERHPVKGVAPESQRGTACRSRPAPARPKSSIGTVPWYFAEIELDVLREAREVGHDEDRLARRAGGRTRARRRVVRTQETRSSRGRRPGTACAAR